MAKIDLSFAELHGPLFLNGISWGVKLFNKQAKGELDLSYDQENGELHVTQVNSGVQAIVPTPNVISMTPKTKKKEVAEAPALKNQHVTEGRKPGRPSIAQAQVSTPQDHVFAAAPGKTRD